MLSSRAWPHLGLGLAGALIACQPGSQAPATAPAPAPVIRADAAAPAIVGPAVLVDTLLGELADCAPGGARCSDRPGALFEAASLLTTRDRGDATGPRLTRLCQELLRSLGAPAPDAAPAPPDAGAGADPGAHEVQVALAGLAVLAASVPEVPAILRGQGAQARLLALVQDPPDALSHGRALLVLGALQPGSPATQKAQTIAAIEAGLRSADRLLRRLSALAAALARDEALDPALLRSLRQLLRAPDGDNRPLAALPALAGPLPADLAVELLPLLPVYVDLLLSTNQPEHSDAALRLTRAAAAAQPESGSAHFFLAQVLARRGDGMAAEPEIRRALATGNLPGSLLRALGRKGQTLAPAPVVAVQRARVRQLLRQRPPLRVDPSRVSAAALRSGAVGIAAVSPAELEAQAARAAPGSAAALRLGAEIFARYPFRSDEYYDTCLRSFLSGDNQDLLWPLGLSAAQEDGGRRVVGVVLVDGKRYGVTCALCHGLVDDDGKRVDGLPSRIYDQGLLLASCLDQPIHHKSGNRDLDQLMAFGPGRNDSTSDDVHNPTEIPSLYGLRVGRAVRWNGDTPSLEVQIDRNLSEHSAPRAVIRALASYLRQLPLPGAAPGEGPEWQRGQALFARECERCHSAPAWTSGAIIPVEVLGTDRARVSAVLPNSSAGYKVPSLLRVARSAPYLHDGSVPSLERLLDPARCQRGCAGHRYGHTLDRAARAALVTYVRSL